jgi:hypothetical protein
LKTEEVTATIGALWKLFGRTIAYKNDGSIAGQLQELQLPSELVWKLHQSPNTYFEDISIG